MEPYAYPLLIKQLLVTPISQRSRKEIVYRDKLRYDYPTLIARIGRLGSALHRAHDGSGPALVEVVVTPMQQDPPAERDPVERMRRLLDRRGEWTQPFQDVIEGELHGQLDKALAQVLGGEA